ncbi:MAG: thioesterase [Flavobacteriaceae bacterium]|nr:thioesterase [Flavobacteriaceae bacterium]|tara:strand:- start:176253 stop:176687 length:435 start_codon:yes stop_codon:yes gene_type:complete
MKYFEKQFEVRWADVDPNMHMRQTAYVDYTDQVRIAYFDSMGFSFLKFRKLKIGPVVFKVTSNYRKEVHLSEIITVNCKIDYVSEDFRKFKISHEIFNSMDELSCVVELEGAWLDLVQRKITVPPQEMIEIMKQEQSKSYNKAS